MLDSLQIHSPIDTLPKICMYSPDNDYYNQFYDVEEVCKCGNHEWTTCAMVINVFENQIAMTPNRFEKCTICKEVRISKLKKEFESIIKTSENLLKTLLQNIPSEQDLLHILQNMAANLEVKIATKGVESNKEKVLSIKKFCDETNIDQSFMSDMMKKMSQESASKRISGV